MKKALILSPHMDDEVLGCSSFLLDPELQTFVLYQNNTHATVSSVTLERENKKMISILPKCGGGVSEISRLNELDQVPILEFVNEYETWFNSFKPDYLVIPFPSYNQDHRVLYEAALTACRPHDTNFFVPKVLLYEEPDVFGTMRKVETFRPTYFRKLDIAGKLVLYSCYESQVRGHRDFEMLKAMSRLRGSQCNFEEAEAFEVLRWIE